MSEDEGGEMQIKLKKKKTRIPKISKEENNDENLENPLKMQRSKTVAKKRKKKINLDDNSDEEATKKIKIIMFWKIIKQ